MNEIKWKISEVKPYNKGAYSLSKYLNHNYKANKDKCIEISESIKKVYDFEQQDKGGIITFSTDVNATALSENKIINFLKSKFKTLVNKFRKHRKIDDIAQKHNLAGWTVGHYLSGRYTAENGKTYGENSLSVEIIGVDSEELKSIAEELCIEFLQESVLVKDYSENKIYILYAE